MIKLLLLLIIFLSDCGNLISPAVNENGIDSLRQNDSTINNGGRPFHITLNTVSSEKIAVRGVSGIESAVITFLVIDSTGKNAANGSEIRFILICGDSVAKLEKETDMVVNGKVSCSVYSGSASGTISLTAVYSERLGEPLVISATVPVLVSGGPPVSGRFSVVLSKQNIPKKESEQVTVTAYLADKYGNPSSGRMVHFSTTSGIVLSGAASDSTGTLATKLSLYSPWPDSSRGVVSASTFDGNGNVLNSTAGFVLSGEPVIQFLHNGIADTFNLSAGGESLVRYTVSDNVGLPLCAGTKISVELFGGGVLVGESEITLPDVISGYTQFSTIVRDDGSGNRMVRLSVNVSGPNGTLTKGIWGRVQ
jgi:hypothetical protein